MTPKALAVVALLFGGAALASAADPAVGSYTFGPGQVFTAKDAIAFGREDYEGKKVVVLLGAEPFARGSLATTLDREGAIEALKEAGSTIELEYREDGTWAGLKYNLRTAGGSSSGMKYDRALAPGMKAVIKDGQVAGKVHADLGGGESLKFTLAVPVLPASAGTPLPADGGDPGRALRACNAAYKAKKMADLQRSCSESLGAVIDSALRMRKEGVEMPDPWTPAGAGHCEVATLGGLELTEGVTAGEEARFTVRGAWSQDGQPRTCAGPVFLRRANGAWRVSASRLDTVSE